MPKTTLTIDGMSCTGCSGRVEEGLSQLDGVRRVSADHETGSAAVELEDGGIDLEDLRRTVEELGYTVTGVQDR